MNEELKNAAKIDKSSMDFCKTYKRRIAKFHTDQMRRCYKNLKAKKDTSEYKVDDIVMKIKAYDAKIRNIAASMETPFQDVRIPEQMRSITLTEYVKEAIFILERRLPNALKFSNYTIPYQYLKRVKDENVDIAIENIRLIREFHRRCVVEMYMFVYELYKKLPSMIRGEYKA